MHPDPELVLLTGLAVVLFSGAAIFFPHFPAHMQRRRNVTPPPAFVMTIFRLWFAVLALASVGLLFFSPHGLLAGRLH